MIPSSAVLTPKNARSRSVTKLCLALETFRRTDEGRVRDAKSFLGFWLPYEAGKDRLFVHVPNEVRADLLSNWGVRGKKSALRDDDEKVRTTLADALGAGDIDAAVIESGVTPEILVDWAPLDDWWTFWRGSALPTGAIRKALATARELDMFDEKWFFQNLALKSQKLEGTDVVSAALSKEQVTAWLLAVHASEDASPAGLMRAVGWDTVLARTAHEALLHALDALAATVGLVKPADAAVAGAAAAAPALAPAAASVPPSASVPPEVPSFPSDPPISAEAVPPRPDSLPAPEPAHAPKTEPAPPLKVEPAPAPKSEPRPAPKPATAAPKSEPKPEKAPPSAKPLPTQPQTAAKPPPTPAPRRAPDPKPSAPASTAQAQPPKSVPPRPAPPPVPSRPAPAKPADSAPPSTRPSARALFGAPAASPGPGPVRPKALTLAGVGGELPMFGDPLDPPELDPPSTPTLAETSPVDAADLVPASTDEPAWAPPRAEPGDMGWDLIHGVQRPLTTHVQPKYNFDDDDEPTSEIALPGDPHHR